MELKFKVGSNYTITKIAPNILNLKKKSEYKVFFANNIYNIQYYKIYNIIK